MATADVPPLWLLVFTAFVVYVTWMPLQGANSWWGGYLSPLCPPKVLGGSSRSPLEPWLGMLALVVPLAVRITCYYYQGALHKPFWAAAGVISSGRPV
jgi:hypothetical protein